MHNRKPSQSDPAFLKFHQSILEIDSKVQMMEQEIRKQQELALKQMKSRSVSPSNGVFKFIRKSKFFSLTHVGMQKDSKEAPYGIEVDPVLNKKEISPLKNSDGSFFSNENDISKINFTTNKSHLQFDTSIDIEVNALKDHSHIQNLKKVKFKKEADKSKISEKEVQTSISKPQLKVKTDLTTIDCQNNDRHIRRLRARIDSKA